MKDAIRKQARLWGIPSIVKQKKKKEKEKKTGDGREKSNPQDNKKRPKESCSVGEDCNRCHRSREGVEGECRKTAGASSDGGWGLIRLNKRFNEANVVKVGSAAHDDAPQKKWVN
jgi:hypothetical protein